MKFCKKCGNKLGIRTRSKRGMCRSCTVSGKLNPLWKGREVGLIQLHAWVKKGKRKTKLCECCKKVPPFDLANKGIYNRELKNWEWLCRKCHMIKDGRIKTRDKKGKFKSINH